MSHEIADLFKGIHGETREYFIQDVDKQRHPVNTQRIYDKWIDDAFIQVFGEPARSKACFCLKTPIHAQKYGNVYRIEPVGPYYAYYSNYIKDLHDLGWVHNQVNSGKEFDDEQVAAFAVRVWTSDKVHDKELRYQICNFLEVKSVKMLDFALSYKNAGPRFVSEFYKKTTDFSEIKDSVEILLMCDKIQCFKME